MGLPIPENMYEVLTGLSPEDKLRVIVWLTESMLPAETDAEDIGTEEEAKMTDWPPEEVRFAENLSNKPDWNEGITPASQLSEEEKVTLGAKLFGAWADSTPDDLAEQVISSRTMSTREINLDE